MGFVAQFNQKIQDFKMASGTWWETENLKKRPNSIEGIFLTFYENSGKILETKVSKSDCDDDDDGYVFTNRAAFTIGESLTGNDSYFQNADPDDSMMMMRQNSNVTAIVWKDDVCCVAHGEQGLISVYKAKVNSGGVVYLLKQTLDNKYCSRICDLKIFQNRILAVTFESGEFEYTKIKPF